jgi:hypothetical protein
MVRDHCGDCCPLHFVYFYGFFVFFLAYLVRSVRSVLSIISIQELIQLGQAGNDLLGLPFQPRLALGLGRALEFEKYDLRHLHQPFGQHLDLLFQQFVRRMVGQHGLFRVYRFEVVQNVRRVVGDHLLALAFQKNGQLLLGRIISDNRLQNKYTITGVS